jgi:transposase-like protein
VDVDDILLIGYSGKRNETGTVGEHGEGEIVSFVVAARREMVKVMASRNWLAVGRLEQHEDRTRLVLDIYRTQSPRTGTMWLYIARTIYTAYSELLSIHKTVAKMFSNHAYHKRANPKRVLVSPHERGKIYSRGLLVTEDNETLFGYNLALNPGRDRAKFSGTEIRTAIKEILTQEATPEIMARIIAAIVNGSTWKIEPQLDFDVAPDVVKKALEKVTRSKRPKIAWGIMSEPETTDAKMLGVSVMQYWNTISVPAWVTKSVPHVDAFVRGPVGLTYRVPKKLEHAAAIALKLLGARDNMSVVAARGVRDDSVLAACNEQTGTIYLYTSRLKNISATKFLGIMAHELAHYTTRATDCTRSHAIGIQQHLTHAMHMIATNPQAQEEYLKFVQLFNTAETWDL